jgi:hypothetical protein
MVSPDDKSEKHPFLSSFFPLKHPGILYDLLMSKTEFAREEERTGFKSIRFSGCLVDEQKRIGRIAANRAAGPLYNS